jgi:hypothetical protein
MIQRPTCFNFVTNYEIWIFGVDSGDTHHGLFFCFCIDLMRIGVDSAQSGFELEQPIVVFPPHLPIRATVAAAPAVISIRYFDQPSITKYAVGLTTARS